MADDALASHDKPENNSIEGGMSSSMEQVKVKQELPEHDDREDASSSDKSSQEKNVAATSSDMSGQEHNKVQEDDQETDPYGVSAEDEDGVQDSHDNDEGADCKYRNEPSSSYECVPDEFNEEPLEDDEDDDDEGDGSGEDNGLLIGDDDDEVDDKESDTYRELYITTRNYLLRLIRTKRKVPKSIGVISQMLYDNQSVPRDQLELLREQFCVMLGDQLGNSSSNAESKPVTEKSLVTTGATGSTSSKPVSSHKYVSTRNDSSSRVSGPVKSPSFSPSVIPKKETSLKSAKHISPSSSAIAATCSFTSPGVSTHTHQSQSLKQMPLQKGKGKQDEPGKSNLSSAAQKLKDDYIRSYLERHKKKEAAREEAEKAKARELAIEEAKQIILERGETPDNDIFLLDSDLPLAGSFHIAKSLQTNPKYDAAGKSTSTPDPKVNLVRKDDADYETPEKKLCTQLDPMELLQNKQFLAALRESLSRDSSSTSASDQSMDLSSIKKESPDSSFQATGTDAVKNRSPPSTVVDTSALKSFFSKKGSKGRRGSKGAKGDNSAPNSPPALLVSPTARTVMGKPTSDQLRAMTEQKRNLIREFKPVLQSHCNTRTYNPLVGKLFHEGYQVVAEDIDNLPNDTFFRLMSTYFPDLEKEPISSRHTALRKLLARYIAENDSTFTRAWIEDEIASQKHQFYSYLQRLESEDFHVDGAQVVILSIMLCRNITIISPDAVLSSEPTVSRDIILVHLGDQQFTAAQVGSGFTIPLNKVFGVTQEQQLQANKWADGSAPNQPTDNIVKPFQCKVCLQTFLLEEDLVAHEPVHVTGVPCPECSFVLSSVTELIDHLSQCHRIPYECKVCKAVFQKPENLEKHKAIHSVSITCDLCHATFQTQDELSRHATTHLGASFTCDICKCLFDSSTALRKHMSVHQPESTLKCDYEDCGQVFTTASALAAHMQTVHKSVELKCPSCQMSFEFEHEKNQHIRDNHVAFHCVFCPKVFERKGDKPRHELACKFNKDRPLKCKKCKKNFQGQKVFNDHVKKLHPGSLLCQGCSEMFDKERSLNQHSIKCAVLVDQQCNDSENSKRSLRSKPVK